MESRSRVLFLTRSVAVATLACFGLSGCAALKWPWWGNKAEDSDQVITAEQAEADEALDAPPRVIDPEVERREIKRPKIDTENWEVGGYYGFLSVEDFGTNPSYGVKAAYHVTEDFFFEANVGRTKLGLTSFELLNPGAPYPATFCIHNVMPGYGQLHCDFFFVSPEAAARVTAWQIDQDTQASDHQPLVLTLS